MADTEQEDVDVMGVILDNIADANGEWKVFTEDHGGELKAACIFHFRSLPKHHLKRANESILLISDVRNVAVSFRH